MHQQQQEDKWLDNLEHWLVAIAIILGVLVVGRLVFQAVTGH
jgi:hypothetical protein